MTRNVQTIHPDKPLRHALHITHAGGFRHVTVVEHRQPVGIVSARDALGEPKDFVYELLHREQAEQVLS